MLCLFWLAMTPQNRFAAVRRIICLDGNNDNDLCPQMGTIINEPPTGVCPHMGPTTNAQGTLAPSGKVSRMPRNDGEEQDMTFDPMWGMSFREAYHKSHRI